MSGVLPSRKLPKDQRVSVCKLCGTGIFSFQSYLWQNRPLLGYVHTDCLREREPEGER